MKKKNHFELLSSKTIHTQKYIICTLSKMLHLFVCLFLSLSNPDLLVWEGEQAVENVKLFYKHKWWKVKHLEDLSVRPYV